MSKVRDNLGPFRLSRLIRAGSSCMVWEAVKEDEGDKRYALKVLRGKFATQRTEISYLKHEYAVVNALNHPRIIKSFGYYVEKNTPFIVLELFSELNMKQAMREGTETTAYLVESMIDQSAEALYYLHGKGWIHCDLKPDNFLINREARVKLIDFAISERRKTGIKKFLPNFAKVRGTRSYMSPEQIRGKSFDESTDIYSLGCVIYELLTGKPPYTGDTPNDLLNKHLSAPIPSPRVSNPNVSSEMTELLKKMLAKKAKDRHQSMWEFLKEFRTIKPFIKSPRIPEKSIFDANLTARANPEDMLNR